MLNLALALFLCLFGATISAEDTLLASNHTNLLNEFREDLTDFSEGVLISKPKLKQMLSNEEKEQQTHIKLSGPDSQTRTIAVTFQRAFEQSIIKMIHSGKLKSATAIIHTERPTTPLCHKSDKLIDESLPESIKADPQRLKTLKDRTQTVRLLAKDKHIDLYIAYANGGLKRRSDKEQKIFQEELRSRKNIALHNAELSCPHIPKKLSGATYILKLTNGENLFFSLNGSQVQDADNTMDWEYWFDSLKNPEMQDRLDKVINFLNDCGLNIKV